MTITDLKISSVFPEAFVVIRFKQKEDMIMIFEGVIKGDHPEIFARCLKKNNEIFTVHKKALTDIFNLSISIGQKENEYIMNMNPLKNSIRLKSKNGKFIAYYPEEKKLLKIRNVTVSAKKFPLSLSFSFKGYFRKSKTSPKEIVSFNQEADKRFTNALYNYFME